MKREGDRKRKHKRSIKVDEGDIEMIYRSSEDLYRVAKRGEKC
jgi:hypothetical protein